MRDEIYACGAQELLHPRCIFCPFRNCILAQASNGRNDGDPPLDSLLSVSKILGHAPVAHVGQQRGGRMQEPYFFESPGNPIVLRFENNPALAEVSTSRGRAGARLGAREARSGGRHSRRGKARDPSGRRLEHRAARAGRVQPLSLALVCAVDVVRPDSRARQLTVLGAG